MKLSRLSQRGHAHIIVPMLVMVVVAFIGARVYNYYSHAQSVSCISQTFAKTSSTTPVTCVQYIQQMLNGIYAYNVGTDSGNNIVGLGKHPGYANLWEGSYRSDLLLVNNQFGKVSSVYDAATANQVMIYQRSVATPGTLPVPNGKVDAQTWQHLCTDAVNTQLSGDGHTIVDRDIPVSAHTPEGYADSYRRAGVTAGKDAGCATPTPQPSPTASNYNECQELGGKHSSTATNESCTLNGKVFTVASDDVPQAWSHFTTSTVSLLKWKVTFTTPQALVGDLYDQVDPGENIYDFTTTKMFAPSCIAYFNAHNQEASVELDQYPTNKAAVGIAPNAGTMTLLEYFNAHRTPGTGSYFLDTKGRQVWLRGNHFYEFLTDTSLYQGSAFTTACPGVTSDYQAQLAAVVSTIKE